MPQRNGFTRGTRPASPGNLTARVFNENQQRAEAERRLGPEEVAEIRRTALREGIDAGYDAGFEAGYRAGIQALIEADETNDAE